MKWSSIPETYGWYFFTPSIIDWDLAEPIRVESHTMGADPTFYTARFKKGEVKITANMGYWYGPLRIPRPVA